MTTYTMTIRWDSLFYILQDHYGNAFPSEFAVSTRPFDFFNTYDYHPMLNSLLCQYDAVNQIGNDTNWRMYSEFNTEEGYTQFLLKHGDYLK